MSGARPSKTRRAATRTIEKIQASVRRILVAAKRASQEKSQRKNRRASPSIADHWDRVLGRLLRHGNATVGNSVTVMHDGDEVVESMWKAMSSARRRIGVEMYTVEPDRVGRRTIDELTQAASRGCEIALMIDGLGSSNISDAALRPLREADGDRVEIRVFNPLRLWSWPVRRNHRKIIIVDDKIGFCGGMNLSEDYAGPTHGNGLFHDSVVRLEGPCVRDLVEVFERSWRTSIGPLAKRRRLPRRSRAKGESFVQVQESQGAVGRRSIQRALRLTIRNALDHCYITTPYFVPPLRLVRTIRKAAERGVDVRILTAGVSDVPIVSMASQHIYGGLLNHGVRIFEMDRPILHAKRITIDGVYSSVGSFNLDTWSDKRNMECNVAIIDPAIAEDMHRLFLKNLETAREVTGELWGKRSLWQRLVHWTAYQLMRL
jgi:cardiolipin synthase